VNERKAEALTEAVAALGRGEVIAFPTETLYGLGADALDGTAVEKVFQLKGRDAANPIPVLIADRAMLSRLVSQVPPLADTLIARFWPGPLTIVLPARPEIPRPLVNTTGGIGLRVSSQPIAAELVQGLGRPITATSANLSGQPAARTVAEARRYFSEVIDVFVDGGTLVSKTGSTVVEIVSERIKIIRQGDIARAKIEEVVDGGRIIP
jgi:L-threonylcarbamoyladenylate synthase